MDVSTDTYVAILTLYARYARAIDTGDGDGWAACYASTGRYVSSTFGTCTGREELSIFAVDHYKRWLAKGVQTRHWNNHVLIEDNGDGSLSSSVYLLLAGVTKGEAPNLYLQTIYTDRLIRENERWVLAERRSDADMKPDPSQIGFSTWDGTTLEEKA